jgi:ABC-type multidrug transport system ATPase subunit
VVVLDEPTQGLDDAHILKLRRYILENQANRLIIIASHHLAEMSEVATKTVRLSEGRCVDA